MGSSTAFNLVLIAIAMGVLVWLLRPRLRGSERWRAMLTPLSSIIGSGFLVMAPLLASIVGDFSPFAVFGIVLFAYAIGHVMRFNILHVEPRSLAGTLSGRTREVEYLGNIALVIAYVVAVAFYLSLLSSFLMSYVGIPDITAERWLTSGIILLIALVGYLRGLGGLEKLESFSMVIQLAIVAALLVGLGMFSLEFLASEAPLRIVYQERSLSTQVQMLAGALLVVQGFETSRFLGDNYSPAMRVKSMRDAQIISGVLYVASVALFLPVVQTLDLVHVQLPQIVQATGAAALVLPAMLMIAALTSQFSAAVADTCGAGGLVHQNSNRRVSVRVAYIVVSVCAVLLVWTADLIEIIALASRAFATYYFLQTLLALFYCYMDCPLESRMTKPHRAFYLTVALALLYVMVFAIPAE